MVTKNDFDQLAMLRRIQLRGAYILIVGMEIVLPIMPTAFPAASSATWAIPASLFLSCLTIIVMPDVWAIFNTPAGAVWVPIGSSNYRVQDAYYYAAWVREIISGEFPPISPTANEQSHYSIELFKLASLTVSALPSLLISEPRIQLLISMSIFPALTGVVSYFFARGFLVSPRGSFIIGVIAVFHYGAFSKVGSSFEAWYAFFRGYFAFFSNLVDYEFLNDNFRFVNASSSWALTLFLVLAIQRSYLTRNLGWVLAAGLLSALEWFIYLPQAIVTHLLVGGLLLIGVARRDWNLVIRFAGIAAISMGFLLVIDFRTLLSEASANTVFYESLFKGNVRISISELLDGIASLRRDDNFVSIFLKYAFFFILMLTVAWARPVLRDWVLALGLVVLALMFLAIVMANTDSTLRFFKRGLDLIWVTSALCVISARCGALLAGFASASRSIRHAINFFVVLLGVLVVALPAYGFSKLGMRAVESGSHYISADRWDAYIWLSQNLDQRSQVAALDWDDVYMLPVYVGCKLAFGHWIIDNRSAGDEFARYVSIWKALGLERGQWTTDVSASLTAYNQLMDRTYASVPKRRPFVPHTVFNRAMLAHGLLYWPFNSKLNGVEFAAGRTATTVSAAFIEAAGQVYDLNDGDLDRFGKLYFVIPSTALQHISKPVPGHLAYRNPSIAIYRRYPAATPHEIR